jgi:uncharacterized protein
MPTAPTFPGVYIEEVPSGVRTITGVATAITAFIGTAPRGATDEPVTITSFGDYERLFGGLAPDSMMSYAVRDFYLNGGSQAIVVRVVRNADRAQIALPTHPLGTTDPLTLEAASPGRWANVLRAGVDYDTKEKEVPDSDLFNLTLFERVGDDNVPLEKFLNVSLVESSPRFLPRVLQQGSLLVRVRTLANGDPVIPTDPVTQEPLRPLQTLSVGSPPQSPLSEAQDPIAVSVQGTDGDTPEPEDYRGTSGNKRGLHAFDKADLFNILCIPPAERGADTPPDVWQEALEYCRTRRAMLIVDPPAAWGANIATAATAALDGLDALNLSGDRARNAAIYFPRVRQVDPFLDRQLDTFVPCGILAGVWARTDAQRGVWKAPAGIDASLNGVEALQVNLDDAANGRLNPAGINCLRAFPGTGRVVWGARTMRGADRFGDEYKYVPVRRLALFIEESLYRGTQWVVFEPNDEPLWAQIRLNVGAFMHNLFRQGAFQGRTPREAYLVKCDKETTTQNDINLGIVNILVGFAPLKPAEFVIIKIQQLAGQVEV